MMKKYEQITQYILEKIEDGTFKERAAIPSERVLSEMLSASRMTVRQSIDNLVVQNVLYRIPGKGTFISPKKISRNLSSLLSFSEELYRFGFNATTTTLIFEVKKATRRIAKHLEITIGDEIYYIERIRYGNDEPLVFERVYLPMYLFPKLSQDILTKESLYTFVDQHIDAYIDYSYQTVEAKLPNKNVAQMLNIELTEPIMKMTFNSFLTNRKIFEYVESYYRADKYMFTQIASR